MMKKMALFMALTMCMTMVTPAFALEQHTKSREEQVEEILQSTDMEALYKEAEANMTQEKNGNPFEDISISCETSCDATEVTRSLSPETEVDTGYAVKELGALYDPETGEQTGPLYTVAAVAANQKTSSGDSTEDRVITRLHLTWIDNLGVENELVGTSGSWEYESTKEVEDKTVLFGSYSRAWGFQDCIERRPGINKMEFSYKATKTITGLTFASEASLHAIGYGYITLKVVTSVYD